MIRRKNPQYALNNQRIQHSPIRFQRQNSNYSPGLSPMRCRTPTRNNVSPIRISRNKDHLRAPSPIRFVRNGKNQTHMQNYNRQRQRQRINTYQFTSNYATTTAYNNHAAVQTRNYKAQSQYEEHSQNSYISTRQNENIINRNHSNNNINPTAINTKLFSNLVSKLNSDKKKEVSQVKAIKKKHSDQNQNKTIPSTNKALKKTISQQEKPTKKQLEGVKNIQSVQSIGYEGDSFLHKFAQLHKKGTTKTTKTQVQTTKYKNNTCGDHVSEPANNSKSQKQQKQKNISIQQIDSKPVEEVYNEQDTQFEGIRLCIDKLKQAKNTQIFESFSRQDVNVNFSLMNMDPFI